jgi:ATP/maltotriose-dependent transcriptional regulator MalT
VVVGQVEKSESDLAPPLRHIIKRPRLTRLLDESQAPVLLLVAPAGYGKTTLAREWIATKQRQALWCALERSSSDPAALAKKLATALRPVLAEGGTRRLAQYLRSQAEPDPGALGVLLAEETRQWPIDTWLVVDDYQWVLDSEASEEIIREYLRLTRAQALITSRVRPSWINARALLYGHAFELGQSALALTHAEAKRVLADKPSTSGALIALADGWPAVIGLASFVRVDVSARAEVASALHDFFAEELFGELDANVQGALALIAAVGVIDDLLLDQLLGRLREPLITSASRRGLLTQHKTGLVEIHPLVRAFLIRRIGDFQAVVGDIGLRLVDLLLSGRRWDDAFSVIEACRFEAKLGELLGQALEDTLAVGRTATLEHWVAWGQAARASTPELLLAQAELFVRRGERQSAEALAQSAANSLCNPELKARAFLCAGRAASLSDRAEDAERHFAKAVTVDDSLPVRQQAAWGQFISAAYLTGDDSFRAAYAALQRMGDPSPTQVLRLRQAELIYVSRFGNVAETVDRLAGVESLLELVDDPVARTGFLNNLAHGLNLAARYKEAERVAKREYDEARRARLEFVLPTAHFNTASAGMGQGAFAEASAAIDRAVELSDPADSYATAFAAALSAKVHLSRADANAAAKALSISLDGVRRDLRGEVSATLAFVEALQGRDVHARAALSQAHALMLLVETRVLCSATEVVLAFSADDALLHEAIDGLAHVVSATGNYDNLVCALRASPSLLELMITRPQARELVEIAALRSADSSLCAAVGRERPDKPVSAPRRLSRRECDILRLVSQGFHNDEIGRRLFISPMTVKTHLQNVYAKLEVSSRTAAVTKARAAGYLIDSDPEWSP